MSDNWEGTLDKFQQIKILITSEAKRVLKVRVPKSQEVRNEVRDNLVNYYNQFIKIVVVFYSKFNEAQYYTVKKLFAYIRDKVIRSFQVLKVTYKVPTSCTKCINPEIIDEDLIVISDGEVSSAETSDTEVGGSEIKIKKNQLKVEISEMATSAKDFFDFASKVLPQVFDGTPDRLQSFLDALSLLGTNCEGNTQNAVAFVKTRLSGKARDLIEDGDSLEQISQKLKRGIITENSQLVSAKLLSLKQYNKEPAKYAAEVESLALSLKRAYISEGVPINVAESYAANTTVKALKTNAQSERIKLVMEAGTFVTCQEALTKFVNITSEATSSTVLFTRQHRANRGHYNRGRNNFLSNYNRSNNGNPNCQTGAAHGQRYRGQNYRGQNQSRGFRSNFNRGYSQRNPRNTSYVRIYGTPDSSENQQDPHLGPMEDL